MRFGSLSVSSVFPWDSAPPKTAIGILFSRSHSVLYSLSLPFVAVQICHFLSFFPSCLSLTLLLFLAYSLHLFSHCTPFHFFLLFLLFIPLSLQAAVHSLSSECQRGIRPWLAELDWGKNFGSGIFDVDQPRRGPPSFLQYYFSDLFYDKAQSIVCIKMDQWATPSKWWTSL